MDQSTRNEINTRVKALRSRYSVHELRELFMGRQHDTLFSYIGELVMMTPPLEYKFVMAWEGYDLAVGNQYSKLAQEERYQEGRKHSNDDDN